MSSANEGVDLELEGECLGTGADSFLIKVGETGDFSGLASDSDCGCEGEFDLCEEESMVEAGEGGARDSRRFPGAVLGRLSNSGGLNNGIEPFSFSFSFSFSLFLDPFRLYHLSFPVSLLFGDVGSADGLPGMGGISSNLLRSWDDVTMAGEDALPEADELVETETASSFSPLWRLILTEGTCRKEWKIPSDL